MIINQKFAVPGCASDFENTPVSGVYSAISGLRYYNPSLGRFINQDPIQEQGGINLYGFAGNNSVSRWDVLGLDGTDEAAAPPPPPPPPAPPPPPGEIVPLEPFEVQGHKPTAGELAIENYNNQQIIDAVNSDLLNQVRTNLVAGIPGFAGSLNKTIQDSKTKSAEKIRDKILKKLCADAAGRAAVQRLAAANASIGPISGPYIGGQTTRTNGVFHVSLYGGAGVSAESWASRAYHESIHVTQGRLFDQRDAATSVASQIPILQEMEEEAYLNTETYTLDTWRWYSKKIFVTQDSGGGTILNEAAILKFADEEGVAIPGSKNAAEKFSGDVAKARVDQIAVGGWDCAKFK